MLLTLAGAGDAHRQHIPEWVTPFHSAQAPKIALDWYFAFVALNSGLQDEQATAVLVLIERMCKSMADRQAPILVSSLTAHR